MFNSLGYGIRGERERNAGVRTPKEKKVEMPIYEYIRADKSSSFSQNL